MLTDTKIKSLKPRDKAFKLADQKGLCVEVRPSGSKFFRLRYRVHGKEKVLTIGEYPIISLMEARERQIAALKLISEGVDPQAERKKAKQEALEAVLEKKQQERSLSFSQLYDEYCRFKSKPLKNGEAAWSYSTLQKHNLRFKNHVLPDLGSMKINEISETHLEDCLIKIQEHGTLSIRDKVKTVFLGMFEYASGCRYPDDTKYVEHNYARLISTSRFVKRKSKPFAHAGDEHELKQIVNQVWALSATYEVQVALKLAMLTFLRPINVAQLKWAQIDFENKQLRISALEMKMDRDFIVPLSDQAVDLLRGMQEVTGYSDFVFLSPYGNSKPISRDSLSNALRNNGIPLTAHGMRHSASTALNNLGYDPDAIELQLSHVIGGVRGVYNKAQKLDARIKMMQGWADYLDKLLIEANL